MVGKIKSEITENRAWRRVEARRGKAGVDVALFFTKLVCALNNGMWAGCGAMGTHRHCYLGQQPQKEIDNSYQNDKGCALWPTETTSRNFTPGTLSGL